MKRLAIACVTMLVCAGVVLAVPSFTPVIDGVKDAGWGNTPDHSSTTQWVPTEFNFDEGVYVTDDALAFYFGFMADGDPWVDNRNPHIHFQIDKNTAAGGSSDPWGSSQAYAHPFLPEYEIIMQWGDAEAPGDSAIEWTGFVVWNGSSWNTSELTTDAGGRNTWTEIKILKSQLGITSAGEVLHLSMWLRPSWNQSYGTACLPADATFGSDFGNTNGGAFDSQFEYIVQASLNDTDPPGIDHVKQIDRDEVEIVFDEPMDVATLIAANFTAGGWSINSVSYATATTVGLKCNFNFVEGSPYTVTVDPEVTDAAENVMDPADDEATWTAVDYSDVVIVVAAPAVYTCIRFKGSFNFYHERDGSWSGGSQVMYDDGTHGDTTAGDGRHTILWPLVPDPTAFEWGAETCGAQWLIQGPNQQISVTDGSQAYYGFYQVPDVTTAPCDITFRCDMQFVDDAFTGVHLAGAAMGWNYPGLNLTDGDLDEQFTLVYTLPAGSPRNQEFKFQFSDGDADQEWEGISNRSFTISGAPTSLDLGNMFYNDVVDAPYNLTCLRNGTNARLRWNQEYQRVNFEVFARSEPDSILEYGTSLGTVGTNVFDDPFGPDFRKFYLVRTVTP